MCFSNADDIDKILCKDSMKQHRVLLHLHFMILDAFTPSRNYHDYEIPNCKKRSHPHNL